MLFLLLCYLLVLYDTQATPVPTRELAPRAPSSANLHRSMFKIIWTCVSTTIICAWVSVHPNIPPRSRLWTLRRRIWLMFWTIIAPEMVLAWAVRQRSAARMVQREFKDHGWTETHGHFLIMGGFTLINGKIDNEPQQPEKPEKPWYWYSRNRELDERYERERLQYVEQYRRYNLGPVSFDQFKELVNTSEVDFPTFSLADIQDKSKGDFLSKSLAVIQTTWFLVQCAARVPQGLALTELELVTLALASLNAVTYYFWWNKPLQVQEPVKLFLKKTKEQVEEEIPTAGESQNEVTIREVLSKIHQTIEEVGSLFWRFLRNPCKHGPLLAIAFVFLGTPIFLLGIFLNLFPIAIVCLLSVLKTGKSPSANQYQSEQNRRRIASQIVSGLRNIRITLTTLVHDFFQERLDPVVRGDVGSFVLGLFILFPLQLLTIIILVITLLPLFALFFLISFLFNSIFGIIATDALPRGARQIPAFYAPRTTSDRYSRMLVFAFFGALFGGLHGLAWNFEFPHPFEQTLWRVGSIIITGIPLVVAPIDFLLEKEISWLPKFALSALDLVMTILLFIYVPTRLSLISQSIALLRAQPPSAFISVNWVQFIPHIFAS